MQQKLILPLNRTLVTASMGNAAYRAKFGFPHYGTDMVSAVGDTTIYASGTGTLIAAGWDKYAGNVVVIRYPGAVYRPDGTAADVIFRYFHLAEIGKIPARGKCHHQGYHSGTLWRFGYGQQELLEPASPCGSGHRCPVSPLLSHLHPQRGDPVRAGCGATAATLRDCLDYLYRKTSAPDRQTYQTAGAPYVDQKDFAIPVLPE